MKSLLVRIIKKIYLYVKCVYVNKATLLGWIFLVLGVVVSLRCIRHPFSSEFAEAGLIAELVVAVTLLALTKFGYGTVKSYIKSYKLIRKRVARDKSLDQIHSLYLGGWIPSPSGDNF